MKFPSDVFSNRRFAVLGLGRNGLPAARALCAMGAAVVAWDDREAARDAAAAEGIPIAEPEMAGLDALLVSPGIPHALPKPHPIAARAIAAGVPILTDADLLYRAVRKAHSGARFVGITGTNGKSTTTALLAHILTVAGRPVAAGGNLGTPALALPLLPQDGVYVLEMSSYMLERIAAIRFDAAAMLNLSPDHLDRHGDMDGYARAKLKIFDRQTEDDTAIVGIDDPASQAIAEALAAGPAPVETVSGEKEADFWPEGGMLREADGPFADLAHAPALPGAHNAQNAAAAAALALALDVPHGAIAQAIATFPGLPHRQERVAVAGGVTFVNDSKATNADSTARALACYERVVWIAGGRAKAGGIESLRLFFPRVALALLIGEDAPALAATLGKHKVAHREVGTLEAAVAAAWEAARGGAADVVLLSPACASFDQFTNFEQRGDRFRALAEAIAQEAAGAQDTTGPAA
jgi:UDP-N-acetylmuramoylalanine--D-glutamate ligase